MEEIAYLFNGDFESQIFLRKNISKQSSKMNQEFEYFISFLNPDLYIYTHKVYTPEFQLFFKDFTGKNIQTSTQAKEVIAWCNNYENLDLIKKLQDKVQTLSFLLENNLIQHKAQVINKESKLREGFLYKDPYSLSGMGHMHIPQHEAKVKTLLSSGRVLIEEEILDRDMDFSILVENNKFVAIYENYVDEYYQYKGTYLKPELKFTHTIQREIDKALENVLTYAQTYSGPLSIDAFTYRANEDLFVHPCCEINARKTMGYFTYHFKQKYFSSSSHFKLILQRNKKQIRSRIEVEKLGALLISPLENQFYVICIPGNSEEEVSKKELSLFSTFF